MKVATLPRYSRLGLLDWAASEGNTMSLPSGRVLRDPWRVMLYSQDGLGLGHLRRTTSIAAALVRAVPSASVLIVTDSPLGKFFRSGPNQDFVNLPTIVKKGPGNWVPVGSSLSFDQTHHLRREMLLALARSYRPDLLLVDHMPHGAMGELLPALRELRRQGGRGPRIVLGLRDIVDAPDVVERVWSNEGAHDALAAYYDRVIVYGCQDVFDVGQQYGCAPQAVEKIRYAGYACTPSQPRYPNRIRAIYRAAGDRPLVVVTAGAGTDAYPMLSITLEALTLVREQRPCAAVMITGPLMPARFRTRLERQANSTSTRVRASVRDALSYVHAADAVVSTAGYNSTVEVLRARVPALLVPRAGPSAEQRIRAELFSARCWAQAVDPLDLSPEPVAASLLRTLDHPQPGGAGALPALDGVDVAVDLLLGLLGRPNG